MDKQTEAALAEMRAEIAGLRQENAALRAGSRIPIAPATMQKVLFIDIAERTVDGEGGMPVRDVVGRPGQEVELRADRAAAWRRRGKCVPVDSDEADAYRKDLNAREQAEARAAEADRKARAADSGRAAKLQEAEDAAAKKKAAAG